MNDVTAIHLRFGERVRTQIAKSDITCWDLAKLCSLPADRLKQILSGCLTRLTLADMAVIAHRLGVPLFDLLAPGGAIAEALKEVE